MASTTHRGHHEITTPRLIIRNAVHEDAQAIANLRGNPENNPHTPTEPDLYAEIFEERIRNWKASAELGENAFMVIILRNSPHSLAAPMPTAGQDGTLIGFGGYNSLARRPAWRSSATEVLVGDTGVMIDHSHWHKGYAREALCATVEYGLYTLGCDHITADTSVDNEPWRALMRSVGLDCVEEQRNVGSEQNPQLEWIYRFGRVEWEKARDSMIARGKWML